MARCLIPRAGLCCPGTNSEGFHSLPQHRVAPRPALCNRERATFLACRRRQSQNTIRGLSGNLSVFHLDETRVLLCSVHSVTRQCTKETKPNHPTHRPDSEVLVINRNLETRAAAGASGGVPRLSTPGADITRGHSTLLQLSPSAGPSVHAAALSGWPSAPRPATHSAA